jgi:hypothetical protein
MMTKKALKALQTQARTGVELEGAIGLGMRGLRLAAKNGDEREMASLLAQVDVSHWRRPFDGAPIMHLAARSGSASCVKMLLAAKAPVGTDANWATPLAAAAAKGSLDCVRLLTPHCDPLQRDKSGSDALSQAIMEGRCVACAHALIPLSDLRPSQSNAPTALFLALASGMFDVVPALVERLLDQGADPESIRQSVQKGSARFKALALIRSRVDDGADLKALNAQAMAESAIERWALERAFPSGLPQDPSSMSRL